MTEILHEAAADLSIGVAPSLPRIAFAHTGTSSQLVTLADPALAPYRMQEVYLPDLEPGGLAEVDVLLVADRSHPALLRKHAAEMLAVAERGGVLVVFGENAVHTWLPGVRWDGRETNFWWWRTGEDHGMRCRNLDDPIWRYFSERAVIWHHHGVFQPPPGAVPLIELEEDGRVAGATSYVDRVSTQGVLFVATMDPCFHHGAAFMPGATQLLYQTVRWAEDVARESMGCEVAGVGSQGG